MSASAPWAAVRLLVRPEDEEPASGLLWEAGCGGLEIQAPTSAGALPIVAYFPARAGLLEGLAGALALLTPLALDLVSVPEVDWEAQFKESFRPFSAGGFRIVPVWDDGPRGEDVLVVEPARAFGTGTHETTRLCLELLAEHRASAEPRRVLDLGCGTGLLAVAAKRLGAGWVLATDNDPEAGLSARAHARRNGADLRVLVADGLAALPGARFDLVLANLMAPLLLRLRDELGRALAPGGALVVSGLLVSDLPEVRTAFAPLGAIRERTDGEWAALRVTA